VALRPIIDLKSVSNIGTIETQNLICDNLISNIREMNVSR